jgi:hypothetical protein
VQSSGRARERPVEPSEDDEEEEEAEEAEAGIEEDIAGE